MLAVGGSCRGYEEEENSSIPTDFAKLGGKERVFDVFASLLLRAQAGTPVRPGLGLNSATSWLFDCGPFPTSLHLSFESAERGYNAHLEGLPRQVVMRNTCQIQHRA